MLSQTPKPERGRDDSTALSSQPLVVTGADGRCYFVYMFLILVNKALWPIGNKIGGARRQGGKRK